MNERERFVTTLTFGTPDKVPFSPGSPRESTLRAWHAQGLPEGADWYAVLMQELDLPYQPPEEEHPNLNDCFKMIPTFEEKVIAHRDGHYIVQDWMGAVTEISDEFDYTYIRSAKDFVTRKWHSFPVQSADDWQQKMLWRYDLSAPGRYPTILNAIAETLRGRDFPFRITLSGPFWQMREWCGLENLCMMLIDDPKFVQELADFWCGFALKVFDVLLERIQPDMVMVNEDMAYKIHSMISPRMTRKVLLPVWQAWIAKLRENGCPVLGIDSDGYVNELMPVWIEAGFNCNFPIEVAAGNDIVALRETYGSKMAFLGGIDKRAIAAGSETMRRELYRVAPVIESGGYIPGCDHGVPPDIAWPDFIEYSRLLAKLTGWK